MIFNRWGLIEARQRRGLTKSALAAESGVSGAYITQIEAGDRTNPSPKLVAEWCRILEISDTRVLQFQPTAAELLRESMDITSEKSE